MARFKYTKLTTVLAASAITVSLLSMPIVRAETVSPSASGYLQQIAINTAGILQAVNSLPTVLGYLSTMAQSFIAANGDTSTDGNNVSYTADFVTNFSSLGSQILNSLTASPTNSTSMLNSLMQGYFSNVTQTTLPNANDLDFQTLMNDPVWSTDPRTPAPSASQLSFNYIYNVSGLSLTHTIPGSNWNGLIQDQQAYNEYFNTISAAQTFNGYLFSQVYNSITQGISPAEQTLLKLATGNENPAGKNNWFTTIGSENLGLVLRQLLMFVSQSYVLQTQLLQAQQQLLAAQALSNSIGLANAFGNGEYLLRTKAQKVLPGQS